MSANIEPYHDENLVVLFKWACNFPGEALVGIVLCIIFGVLAQEALTSFGPYLWPYILNILDFMEESFLAFIGVIIALGVLTWLVWGYIAYSFKFARVYFHEVRVNIWLRVSKNDPDEMLEFLEPTEIKEKELKKVPCLEERKAASSGIGVAPVSLKKKNGTIRKRK
jgi:hypothetical protein